MTIFFARSDRVTPEHSIFDWDRTFYPVTMWYGIIQTSLIV